MWEEKKINFKIEKWNMRVNEKETKRRGWEERIKGGRFIHSEVGRGRHKGERREDEWGLLWRF